jgi:thiamine biosynthesis lipoprotein
MNLTPKLNLTPKQSVILNRWEPVVLLVFALTTQYIAAQPSDSRQNETEELKRFEASKKAMGVKFSLVVYAKTVEQAKGGMGKVFKRIGELDKMMSDYDPESELMKLCRTLKPGAPEKVSCDLMAVLLLSQKISRLSDGGFDPTIGPLSKLWRLARSTHQIPDPQRIQQALSRVNWMNVVLNPKDQTVMFKRAGIQLDLGGIAKGYAADQAIQCFRDYQLPICLVNASGDVTLGDPPPGKKGWTVAISTTEGQKLIIAKGSVASSGDHYQFLEHQGKRYSHIIDPKTGWGLTSRRLVTVVSKDPLPGTTADALASAMSVMPIKKIQQLANQFKGCSVRIQAISAGPETEILFQSGDFK